MASKVFVLEDAMTSEMLNRAALVSPQDLILGAPRAARLRPSLISRAVGGNEQGMVLSAASLLLTRVGRWHEAPASSVFQKGDEPSRPCPRLILWVGEQEFWKFTPCPSCCLGELLFFLKDSAA